MTKIHHFTFGFIDRLFRAFVGTVVVILSFAYAVNAEMFATMQFFALYPIFTALVAWDPFYVLVETMEQYWLDYSILHR